MLQKLVVIAGPDRGLTFPLAAGGKLVVGRGHASDTHLTDPHVSRTHCEVRCEADQVVLADSGSVGGSLVNGQKVAGQQVLRPGDVIRIGDTEMSFESDIADQATLTPPPSKPAAAVRPTQSKPATRPTAAVPAAPRAVPPPQPPPAPAAPAAPAGDIVFAGGKKAAQKRIPPALKPVCAMEGKAFGRYQLERILGAGTVGVVFLAQDSHDHKVVALKVFKKEFAQNEASRQRFVRGVLTARLINHAHVVALHNAGATDGHCWIAMDYVEGESLAEWILRNGAAGLPDWKTALRVAEHVGEALDFIHSHHVIHRNLMPPNILIRKSDGAALLGDVILAKALEGAQVQEVSAPGELVGNMFYMAPERTEASGAVDGRSDLYSLGATLYHLLTGRMPFSGTTLAEVVKKIRQEAPVRPKQFQPHLPDSFEALILKLLAKDPEQRYPTAAALLADLRRLLQGAQS
jgi:pSer/pThr/pTyr-binding forkhead associated (FHA) protein/tRNA A-37 threonylcarbamoyl transferase component Bud32